MKRLTPYLLSIPAVGLLAGLLVVPMALVVRVSLYELPHGRGFFSPGTWSFENYAAVADRFGLELLGFTVLFGFGVAAGTVFAAYPLALLIRALPRCWRGIAIGAVVLPKLAGPMVTLFGLQRLLSAAGPVNTALLETGITATPLELVRNTFGAALAEAYLILPYAVILLYLQLRRIDPVMEAAARGLGASRWGVFRRITLPLSAPGIVLAGRLALLWGLGAFFGPILLGGPEQTTLSVEVHRQAFEYGRWPRAAADAVFLLAAIMLCLVVYEGSTRSVRRLA